jgi:hypothetical protein
MREEWAFMLRTFRMAAILIVALASLASASENAPRQTHPEAFPNVTLVSSFFNDAGYRLQEVVVQGKTFDRTHLRDAAEKALLANGWKSKSPKEREQLALAAVTQILLADAEVLQSDPGVFKMQNHPFLTPEAVSSSSGTAVQAWVHHRSQMVEGPGSYSLESYTFAPTGEMITSGSEDWDPTDK